jgi:predicted amidohydrolase
MQKRFFWALFFCLFLIQGTNSPGAQPEPNKPQAPNLLGWDVAQPEGGWQRWSPRPSLAPEATVSPASGNSTPQLILASRQNRYVLGGWRRLVRSIHPGKTYHFRAEVLLEGSSNPSHSLLCQLRWLGSELKEEDNGLEYVVHSRKIAEGKFLLEQSFQAMPGATSLQALLFLQWSPGVIAKFTAISLIEEDPLPPRKVRVATIYWRPAGPSDPSANISAFARLVDQTASQHPDMILLPEAAPVINTGLTAFEGAQIPEGPAFQLLSEKARLYQCYIIYGAYEKQGELAFNSAFILDRQGKLAGKYRKVQLPSGEVEGGLSPGDTFRTFQLDFGRIGILICHDSSFSEAARVETLDGAEIIFIPIWGGDMPVLRSRAMENGIWVVTSGYDVPSAIISPSGEIMDSTWKDQGNGIAFFEIDLNRIIRRPWLGNWNNAFTQQRRPEAYQRLNEH